MGQMMLAGFTRTGPARCRSASPRPMLELLSGGKNVFIVLVLSPVIDDSWILDNAVNFVKYPAVVYNPRHDHHLPHRRMRKD